MAHIKKPPDKVAKLIKDGAIIKLNLGSTEEGFININNRAGTGVDIVHDVLFLPFPLPSECASLVMARNIVEKIEPTRFIEWMDECWRVLKYEGQLLLSTPYGGSTEWWADPTNVNGVNPKTWSFFDPLAPGSQYALYKPKPWKVLNCYFQVNGKM